MQFIVEVVYGDDVVRRHSVEARNDQEAEELVWARVREMLMVLASRDVKDADGESLWSHEIDDFLPVSRPAHSSGEARRGYGPDRRE